MKKLLPIVLFVLIVFASEAFGGLWSGGSSSTGSVEGTAVLSTGEAGGTKFLREDGDGSSSWQAAPAGGATALDLGADLVVESTSLTQIQTTGDTNSIFTEPSADVLKIDLTKDWPKADTADALAADPSDCGAGTVATAIAANGNLTCSITPLTATSITNTSIATTNEDIDIAPSRRQVSESLNLKQALIRYETLYVDAGAMTACITNPAAAGIYEYATNDVTVDYFAFDGGATEECAQFKMVMPENWDLGTIKSKFFWSSATGSTANDTVEFGLQCIAESNDDALDAAFGTAQVISDVLLATNGADLQVSGATPAITVGGTPVLADMVFCKAYRNTDGTDDMTEDAWLFGALIQYSTSGSPAAW